MRKLLRNKKGQGLVEYAFVVAGVAFIALVALSVFGHRIADNYAIMAGMLPCAHEDDLAAVAHQSFLGLQQDADGNLVGDGSISWGSITGFTATTNELGNNVFGNVGGGEAGATFVGD